MQRRIIIIWEWWKWTMGSQGCDNFRCGLYSRMRPPEGENSPLGCWVCRVARQRHPQSPHTLIGPVPCVCLGPSGWGCWTPSHLLLFLTPPLCQSAFPPLSFSLPRGTPSHSPLRHVSPHQPTFSHRWGILSYREDEMYVYVWCRIYITYTFHPSFSHLYCYYAHVNIHDTYHHCACKYVNMQ